MAAITRDGYVIGASPSDAEDVNYNNVTSGLDADDVQEAIDELKEIIDSNPGTTYSLSIGTGADANKIVLTPSEGEADKITVPYAINAGDANTVNGKTVATSVPENAVFTDNDTTYSFANGTNGFTVTPSGGSAQTVTVTPSFSVGTGDSNGQVKINGTNASVKGLGNDAYTSTNNIVYINNDIPEGATNLSATATAHKITTYRNGFTIPYQMDNTNDGGIIRCRGTSESNCIFEMGTWDDSGGGETIQFNYYPTTSQVTPTYSVEVPKKSGTIALTSDVSAMQSTLQSNFQAGVDSVYNAIRAQGTTPASKSLSDVVNGISTMSTNRYNSGYSNGYNKGVSDADGRSNPSSYNYQTGYNKGVSDADGRSNPSSYNYQTGYNAGKAAAVATPQMQGMSGGPAGSASASCPWKNYLIIGYQTGPISFSSGTSTVKVYEDSKWRFWRASNSSEFTVSAQLYYQDSYLIALVNNCS